MTEVTQAAPVTGHSARVDLGMPPLILATILFLGICPGMALVGLLLGMSSQFGAIVAVLGMLPWALSSMYWGFVLIGALATMGGLNYGRVRAAINSGQTGVSYYVRDFRGSNFIVVDETRRRLCLNGDVVGFDEVKTLSWESTSKVHRLLFTLHAGSNPVRSVDLGAEDKLKTGFARLCNSLGFS